MGINMKATMTAAVVLFGMNAWGMDSSEALSNELNTTMNTMNQEKASLALETEVVSYDNEEYQAAEKQTVFEIQKLNSDIKDLERQSRALAKGAESARIKADLAAKRLQLRKTEQAEAQLRMKKADNEKRKAEHQHSQVKAKVEMTEQQLAQAKLKTRETQEGIREIEKDNKKLKNRIDQVKKMIAQEKKRKDGLRSKRTKVSQEGQRLRTQLARLERSN
ncbi:hypothetical protein [Bdellovibrio sp. HCB337]|uniref:hypothetical protein n=1 Tax=Bdellovibrio sp. HCB337 TaxID=3394358 RepID=UPI0039A6CEF7